MTTTCSLPVSSFLLPHLYNKVEFVFWIDRKKRLMQPFSRSTTIIYYENFERNEINCIRDEIS